MARILNFKRRHAPEPPPVDRPPSQQHIEKHVSNSLGILIVCLVVGIALFGIMYWILATFFRL